MTGKRVLFFSPSAYPLGGVATWLDYMAPGLEYLGWNVVMGLTSGAHHQLERYLDVHPLRDVEPIRNKTGSREGRIEALVKCIRRTHPDIVVGVNIADTYDAVARAQRSPATCRVRGVMSVHGLQPDLFDEIRLRSPGRDAVIASNRLSVALSVEAGFPEDRVFYSPYGVSEVGGVARTTTGGPLRIIYSGRLEEFQKRVFDLVRISDVLHARGFEFTLSIAGAGPDEDELRRRMHRHLDAGRVMMLGGLPHERLRAEIYPRCDAMLISSLWETGPIVAWEAMAQGIAVVSSRFVGSGLEDALHDEQNALMFPIGDADLAASQLMRLADPALRNRLVRQGHALISERYTINTSVESFSSGLDAIRKLPFPPKAISPRAPEAGRLDRLLGTRGADRLRRFLGIRFEHSGPGGEWPHSRSDAPLHDVTFWEKAKSLDEGGVPTSSG